jgi:phosphoglycerate dehydrogenase-like enzyme
VGQALADQLHAARLTVIETAKTEDDLKTFHIALTGDFLDETGRPAYGDAGLDLFASLPYLQCRYLTEQAPRAGDSDYWKRFYSLEVTPAQVAGLAGLVVLRPYLMRATLASAAHNLVVVGRSGAGYDKIDIAACTEFGIALFNVPLALNHPTASSALLLMLALAKRLPQQEKVARTGRWELQAQVMGGELQGRTLGVIGLGHSGRELIRLAEPFAMRVLAYSPHADPDSTRGLGVCLTSLEEVLSEADFLSLHCRLSEQTRGMLGRHQLALMKPSAYLVNVGRGELIDQEALTEMLLRRKIAGAGLDVFAEEPLPPGDPLTQLDNVILTPHWLASTSDVWAATGTAMAEGMLRAAQGLVPQDVVNKDVLEKPEFREKLGRFAENQTVL